MMCTIEAKIALKYTIMRGDMDHAVLSTDELNHVGVERFRS